uniref:Uncharacterized protein n=1 Tax=Bosea sp. NBC_00436 TaxID=2969620 RepID=A0A9E7ZMT2_9HYPH
MVKIEIAMTEMERKLLYPLTLMARQYLVHLVEDTELDSAAMSAGEHTLLILAEYDLVTLKGGHRIRGNWTDLGRRFLEEAYRAQV